MPYLRNPPGPLVVVCGVAPRWAFLPAVSPVCGLLILSSPLGTLINGKGKGGGLGHHPWPQVPICCFGSRSPSLRSKATDVAMSRSNS